MAGHDVSDFMGQHGRQFIIVCQPQQPSRHINMPARKRKPIDFATLLHMKLVKQSWAQTGLRTTLADSLDAIETEVGEIKLFRDFTMKLHADLDLVTFIQ